MPPNPVQNLLNALLDSNLSHPDRMIKFYKQDLDYFFSSKDSDDYQLLTDEYIRNICKEIENSLNNIDVVTIALSPEFCGDWEYSFRIMDIISDHFSLGFEHTW